MIKLKTNPSVTYRIATADDIREYYDGKIPMTMKAVIFYLDGNPGGIGGYTIQNGCFVIFSEMKEDVKVSKQTIWRCAKIVMNMIKDEDVPMYANAENPKFCARLGMDRIQGEIYRWPS